YHAIYPVTQQTSSRAALRAPPVEPGKFSFARKRILSFAREHLLRAQGVARIGKARNNILVGNSRVIRQNIGLGPSIGHQANHELDRNPRSANDRLADQYVGRERDAWVSGHV